MGKRGIMIMGHGSRMAFNKAVMDLHADLLRKKGFENVYIGYNETSYPLISETLRNMVADGMEEIVCVPFFIASGLHMTRDIPAKLGIPGNVSEAVSNVDGKEVRIYFETPFGLDPLLTDILDRRIRDLDEHLGRLGVLIMGHGSKLSYNSDTMEFHAEALRNIGYDNVYIGYNEMNSPTIDDSMAKMLDDGMDQIVAVPLFIALGKHLTADIPPRLHLPNASSRDIYIYNGKEVVISYAHPIGSDHRLTDILEAKIRKHYG
jgi:sirohydrochlorin cobaltochelatase